MALELPKSEVYTERVYQNYRDKFTVLWVLTRKCNFDCEYDCQPEGDCGEFDLERFVYELEKFPRPFRIVITGGEPLLKSWMIDLCKRIGKFGVIEMQTNFSVNVQKFIDAVSPEYIELIMTSFHPKAREKAVQDGVNKFIQDFLHAKSKGFNIKVWNIDYPKQTVEEFLKDCKVLYDAGIVPMRKRYIGNFGRGYIGDSICLKGKKCNAGYGSVSIWENFDMTLCEADRTLVGNLFTGYTLYNEPVICKKEYCGCMGRELIIDEVYDEFYGRTFGGIA